MAKREFIRARLIELRTDPVQYKPYSPAFAFDGNGEGSADQVFVDIPIPSEEVKQAGDFGLVLTMEGLMAMVREVADHIDLMNAERHEHPVTTKQRRRE